MTDLRLIVIEGSSGTGKTTLARALQQRLLPQQWLAFSPDTVLYCLPQTTLERANLHNDWSAIDGDAMFAGACACVTALLAAGNRVLFDCVLMTERRALQLRRAFADLSPLQVRLVCAWDEIHRRTLARGDRTLAEAELGFRSAGRFLEAQHVLDTTHRTAEELAESLADWLEAHSLASTRR